MKIKDYLENLPTDFYSPDTKSLMGGELNVLKPFFDQIDEFKDKVISVVDNLHHSTPSVTITENGVECSNPETKMFTTKDIEPMGVFIDLYGVFLKDGVVHYRCCETNSLTQEDETFIEIDTPKKD